MSGDYVSRDYLLAEYDRQHQGPPGGARKIIAEAPAADVVERPRWIPVTERLPEKHQWCLVVGENLYDMDTINSRGVWTIHDKPYAPIDYWMPLPEPPKEETPTGPYDLLYEEGGPDA